MRFVLNLLNFENLKFIYLNSTLNNIQPNSATYSHSLFMNFNRVINMHLFIPNLNIGEENQLTNY